MSPRNPTPFVSSVVETPGAMCLGYAWHERRKR